MYVFCRLMQETFSFFEHDIKLTVYNLDNRAIRAFDDFLCQSKCLMQTNFTVHRAIFSDDDSDLKFNIHLEMEHSHHSNS